MARRCPAPGSLLLTQSNPRVPMHSRRSGPCELDVSHHGRTIWPNHGWLPATWHAGCHTAHGGFVLYAGALLLRWFSSDTKRWGIGGLCAWHWMRCAETME